MFSALYLVFKSIGKDSSLLLRPWMSENPYTQLSACRLLFCVLDIIEKNLLNINRDSDSNRYESQYETRYPSSGNGWLELGFLSSLQQRAGKKA